MIDTASSAPNKPALRKLSVPLKLITLPKRKVAQTCAQPTTRGSWSLRHEIHMTLNEHTYSKLSSIISSFIMSTIVLSTLSMVFESMEEWKDAFPWDHINYFAYIVFTVEYALRLICYEGSRCRFVTDTMNIIDFIAILPFLVEVTLYLVAVVFHPTGVDTVAFNALRIARLFRLVRLLKLAKYSSDLQLVTETLVRSKASLQTLGFLLAMNIIIFSCLMFEIEQGEWDADAGARLRSDGEVSPFKSIPHTFWWGIVTMTTVGYGDLFPVEPMGKIVGALAMVMGILVVALPITIIGTNYAECWVENEKIKAVRAGGNEDLDRLAREMEQQLKSMGTTMNLVEHLFAKAAGNATFKAPMQMPGPLAAIFSPQPKAPSNPAEAVKVQLELQGLIVKSALESYCKILRQVNVDAALKEATRPTLTLHS